MPSRLIKQIIFGVFYLVVLSALGFGVYGLLFRVGGSCFDGKLNQEETGVDCGGSCLPCALKNLEAIGSVGVPEIFATDGKSTILLRLKNASLDYGADQFRYELSFFNLRNEKIHSLIGDSFIYPGEIKNIVLPAVNLDAGIVARTEVAVKEASWIPAPEFSKPQTQVRSLVTQASAGTAQVRGIVTNLNSYKLSRVLVSAILFNQNNQKIGASKTLLQDLNPFEERSFTIFIPAAGQQIGVNLTQMFVEAIK